MRPHFSIVAVILGLFSHQASAAQCTASQPCPNDQYCKINQPYRNTGVCVAKGRIGSDCSGWNRVPCEDGLICKPVGKFSKRATCQIKIVGKGQACGGGTQYAPQCGRGLYCQSNNMPGSQGVCVNYGKLGDACGGFVVPRQPPCAPGLYCKQNPMIPDLSGKCTRL